MTITHIEAPDIPDRAYPNGGYPTKGARIGPAWRLAWRELEKATARGKALDGKELAQKVAQELGNVSDQTMLAMFARAANAGILAREVRPVTVEITRTVKSTGAVNTRTGSRNRTFYTVNPDWKA